MIVTEIINRDAVTGFSTRLYDSIDLVIKRRLDKISGRKAIVLFTDGLDTSSYQGTYKSTLREVDERDVLIYPVQYDTSDFMNDTAAAVTINNHASTADYKLAGQFLQQLADRTGGCLYKANDRTQLDEALLDGILRARLVCICR